MNNQVDISTRDRVLRAWENSMELVRDYQQYASEVQDESVQNMFKKYAEDEGYHAAELHSTLINMQESKNQ